jgi:hypothetical protein
MTDVMSIFVGAYSDRTSFAPRLEGVTVIGRTGRGLNMEIAATSELDVGLMNDFTERLSRAKAQGLVAYSAGVSDGGRGGAAEALIVFNNLLRLREANPEPTYSV